MMTKTAHHTLGMVRISEDKDCSSVPSIRRLITETLVLGGHHNDASPYINYDPAVSLIMPLDDED
jgi:hypothetical protein